MNPIQYSNELHRKYRERTVAAAEAAADLVHGLLPHIRSAVDIGCGHGYWLKAFVERGVSEYLGLDGDYVDRSQLAIPADHFRAVRLDQPFQLEGRYDLAICVEVAEHLPAAAADNLIPVLCGAAPVVLFSAAIPGQPGDHHINARPHKYWRERFARQGYAALDALRPALWHRDDLLLCYRQNLLLYVRESVLEQAEYAGVRRQPRANCLTLIDEDVLAELTSLKSALKRWVGRAG